MYSSILLYSLVSSNLLTIMSSDECHRTLLMISQHWFRQLLGTVRHQDLQRPMASLGPDELTCSIFVMELIATLSSMFLCTTQFIDVPSGIEQSIRVDSQGSFSYNRVVPCFSIYWRIGRATESTPVIFQSDIKFTTFNLIPLALSDRFYHFLNKIPDILCIKWNISLSTKKHNDMYMHKVFFRFGSVTFDALLVSLEWRKISFIGSVSTENWTVFFYLIEADIKTNIEEPNYWHFVRR